MLNKKDLRLADILLSTGDAAVSSVIRASTGSRFSHAALYVGNDEIIEAIGVGVVRQSVARAMRDDILVSVYRRIRMSDAQAQQVIRYVTAQVGKPYDEAGAAGAGITSVRGFMIAVFAGSVFPITGLATGYAVGADIINRINPEGSFFCSELVALAFQRANVSLGSGAASTTPADISSAHLLNFIGNLKKPSR